MNTIKWKSPENSNIIKHINKHIFSTPFEKKLWENVIDNLDLKKEYFTNSTDKTLTSLYKDYNEQSNNVLNDYKEAYGFYTNNSFSINYTDFNKLTTCVKKDFKYNKDVEIVSCFFRKSTIIDADIMKIFRLIYEQKVTCEKDLSSIKDLIYYCNNYNLTKAFNNINDYVISIYDLNVSHIRAFSFLYSYLYNQFDYYQKDDEKANANKYLKPLIKLLQVCLNGKGINSLYGYNDEDEYIDQILNLLNKLEESGIKNVDDEFYSNQRVLLELAYYSITLKTLKTFKKFTIELINELKNL